MDLAQDLKKRLRAVVLPFLFACIAIYFGFHFVRNDNGLLALRAYDQRLDEAKIVLAQLTAERASLEKETQALRPSNIQLDALAEQARVRLNMGWPSEVLILGR
ncbi:MAG: septum formation initiator family protein [Rhodospirillales bacterium]